MNYTKLVKVREEQLKEQKEKQDQDFYKKCMKELGLEVI